MPGWIADIARRFRQGDGAPLVVRMFLVKLILLRPLLFRPWHHVFTPAIAAAFVELHQRVQREPRCGWLSSPTAFSYLLREVAFLFACVWGDLAPAGSEGETGGAAAGKVPPMTALVALLDGTPASRAAYAARLRAATPRGFVAFRPDAATHGAPVAATCRAFLTLLLAATASRWPSNQQRNAALLAALLRRWAPAPARIRPDIGTLQAMLFSEDRSSRATLSAAGSKVATASGALQVLAEAGEPALTDADFAAAGGRGAVADFYAALCDLLLPRAGRPQLVYLQLASTVGLLLAQAQASAAVDAQTHALSELLPRARAALAQLQRDTATQSAQDTAERGGERYLACVHRIAEAFPRIVDRTVAMSAVDVLSQARGRLVDRSRIFGFVVRVLTRGLIEATAAAGAGGAGASAALSTARDVLSDVVPHFPMLLRAQVAGVRRGGSLQLVTLQLVAAGARFLTDEQLLDLLRLDRSHSLIGLFARHPSLACRKALVFGIILPVWRRLAVRSTSGGAGGASAAAVQTSHPSSSAAAAASAAVTGDARAQQQQQQQQQQRGGLSLLDATFQPVAAAQAPTQPATQPSSDSDGGNTGAGAGEAVRVPAAELQLAGTITERRLSRHLRRIISAALLQALTDADSGIRRAVFRLLSGSAGVGGLPPDAARRCSG